MAFLEKSFLRILLLVYCLYAVGARAQDSPREVRAAAQQALVKGEYETAAALLLQLVEWYRESKDNETIAGMEMVYFNLGLCYYLTGQFGTAEGRFGDYVKRYPRGLRAMEASVYTGDAQRYAGDLDKAAGTYQAVLKKYDLDADWRTDVLCSLARCALARDDWETALPVLAQARGYAPDWARRNWAGTLLATAYLKQFELDKVFDLAPVLMQRQSFTTRSIAFNMAALETADQLFADEHYREALWIYRLVNSREVIETGSRQHLERLHEYAADLRAASGMYRELLRTQEAIGEAEAELEALKGVENYDNELRSRIARSYMETRRYREARRLFIFLHEILEGEPSEEALYLAFHCSTMVKPWDEAFARGDMYLAKYPGGTWYDAVSLTLGQMHAVQKEWALLIQVLSKALEVSPQHESIAECMFLLGYAHFMEERFPESVSWFRRLNGNYPGNDREEEAAYWIGMALLFDGKYELSLEAFNAFLAAYGESIYREDASFRSAVCAYGLSRYREAQEMLAAFNRDFPDSLLRGEATMMLGDIASYYGSLDEAVAHFQDAVGYELNIELYNYCCFKAGEILGDQGHFRELVEHFQAYIERNREESNIPQALHWVVRGLWMQDQRDAALDTFIDGVKRFGADRDALGVDVLLDEWIGLTRKLEPDAGSQAWRKLARTIQDLSATGNRTLVLRLKRLLLYRSGIEASEKLILLDEIVREENIGDASPAVLELIMDEAGRRGNAELNLAAAREIVVRFPETDYGIGARLKLAGAAIENREWDLAREHLQVVIENFATSQEAAQALYMMAQIHLERRQYDEADQCYVDILGVRQWRGPIWPAALFGRGECARLRGRYDKAAAFYERIYLLYANYADWAGKAYVKRAECLVKMNRTREAVEVLESALAQEGLQETDAWREASATLARIRGESQ